MANILFNTTMSGIQGMIWLLRRFDYYVEKSVVDLGTDDSDPHQVADMLRQRATILRSHANRDPQVIRNPHRFDVDRQDTTHISFGHGIHLCLGMTLARVESKIVLHKLFEKFPNLSLADTTPHWQQTPMFAGLESLQLATR